MSTYLDVYTYGLCWPNPGHGGFAAVIVFEEKVIQKVTGCRPEVTSSRMEIMAAVAGLIEISKASTLESLGLERKPTVSILSDSEIVVSGGNEWRHEWARRGWRRRRGLELLNADLWQVLSRFADQHHAQFISLKGKPQNKYAKLARHLAERQIAMHQREFLNVPFCEKDTVKALGAKWCAVEKKWYVPAGKDHFAFRSWLLAAA